MREIRMLRAMWRALETESRSFLNGHEGGNAGYSQGTSYGFTHQRSILPLSFVISGAPNSFSRTTLRPLGPNVIFTAFASILMPRKSACRESLP